MALLAVSTLAACDSDSPTRAQAPPTASTPASAGPDAAICDDSPAAADNAAAVQAAWGVLPQGLRTALSAKGLEPEGAHDGTAPAAVVSGLVGIHIDALLKASPLGGEGEKHVMRITADVYVGLVNKDPAFAAGTKPAGLTKLVRERQTDVAAGRGGYGVNAEYLPAATVADLNALFGPVPDDVPTRPRPRAGTLVLPHYHYGKPTVDLLSRARQRHLLIGRTTELGHHPPVRRGHRAEPRRPRRADRGAGVLPVPVRAAEPARPRPARRLPRRAGRRRARSGRPDRSGRRPVQHVLARHEAAPRRGRRPTHAGRAAWINAELVSARIDVSELGVRELEDVFLERKRGVRRAEVASRLSTWRSSAIGAGRSGETVGWRRRQLEGMHGLTGVHLLIGRTPLLSVLSCRREALGVARGFLFGVGCCRLGPESPVAGDQDGGDHGPGGEVEPG